jgi:lipopolysaccharide transport system ATP-binding protein
MSDLAISLQSVSKCFQRYARPADRLKELLIPGRSRVQAFWALQDISLEVLAGQTLGIVGRNGSGKSTLLQIIVGTLLPTTGNVAVKGRISALLELGSGFNPEFTGRQNVFFNGQLLGLTRQEIEDRFDRIAAFADIGSFLDEPVKTYSSGMFVRLAFAVAINADPDILVVDEALSVGDEAFQRKCFARIHAIRDGGGTILFVSHGAATVIELCDQAILLDRGEMLLRGNPKLVVDKYQKLIYAPPNKVDEVRGDIRRLQGNEPTVLTHKELMIVESQAATVPTDSPEAAAPQPETPLRSPRRSRQPQIRLKPFFDPDLKPATTTTYVSRGATIHDPQITTLDGKPVNCLVGREDYLYTYTVTFEKAVTQVRFGMLIKTISGLELGGASLVGTAYGVDRVEAGSVAQVKFRFKCLLNPDAYFLNAGVSGTVDDAFGYLDRRIDAAMFKVQAEDFSWASGIVDMMVDPVVTIYDRSKAAQASPGGL